MGVVNRLIAVAAAFALAVSFVGLGLGVCLLPAATHGFSNTFAKDDVSPFDRTQLVEVADATRDYSFGAHDELALYQAIYDVDRQYEQTIKDAGGDVGKGFPKLDVVEDQESLTQMREAFEGASELYCYSPDTIAHLDDCYAIIRLAAPLLIVCLLAAVAGLVACGMLGKKRRVGEVLLIAGAVVLVAFLALGIWAVVDFYGLFTSFHQLFFSQGNWTFPYDSLLICALPEPFWAALAALWLVVTLVASVVSIVVGVKLR